MTRWLASGRSRVAHAYVVRHDSDGVDRTNWFSACEMALYVPCRRATRAPRCKRCLRALHEERGR